MKKLIFLLVFIMLIMFASYVYAQGLQTESNPVQTQVGTVQNKNSPSSGATTATCPIVGARITCGSKFTSSSGGCGHCNASYGQENIRKYCNYEGINYAADITIPATNIQGKEVILPSINGESVTWKIYDKASSSIGSTIIYKTNTKNGETYVIQFHHVATGSEVDRGQSGDVGARLCRTGSECDHVHVEFYKQTPGLGRQYIDAAKTFCV
jgi:hypothetical protein